MHVSPPGAMVRGVCISGSTPGSLAARKEMLGHRAGNCVYGWEELPIFFTVTEHGTPSPGCPQVSSLSTSSQHFIIIVIVVTAVVVVTVLFCFALG